eukprot:Rhum_TRINITY_DN21081_c0_g1::Rhum_TRINITY_DN21081_c0_g1_i1::g.173109::m.173109
MTTEETPDTPAAPVSFREEFEQNVTEEAIDIRVVELTSAGVDDLIAWAAENNRDLSKIKEVDVGNNEIEGGKALGRLLALTKNATDVDVRVNHIGKMGCYEMQTSLLGLKSLSHLSLDACELWDYGAEVVLNAAASLKGLQKLQLTDNFISPKAAPHVAKYIAKNTPLQELYLDYNKMGDEGAVIIGPALAQNTNMKVFGFNDNSIACAGCEAFGAALATNKSGLIKLDLSCSKIGVRGGQHLGKALAHNTHLKILDVGANFELCNEGAIALADALRTNTTLWSLDLTNCLLTNDAVDPIVAAIENNTTIRDIPLVLNEEMDMDGKTKIATLFVANRSRPQPAAPVAAPDTKKTSHPFLYYAAAVIVVLLSACAVGAFEAVAPYLSTLLQN